MENRHPIHDDRRKRPAVDVRETMEYKKPPRNRKGRKPHKVKAVTPLMAMEPKDRLESMSQRINTGRGNIEEPVIVATGQAPHTVVSTQCIFCFTPFHRPLVICYSCGNCQYCGLYNQDQQSTVCMFCNNTGDYERLDKKPHRIRARKGVK